MTSGRGARHAARTLFFCSGFLFATWGVHIPTVRAHYGVGETALGLAMLAAGVGALLGLSRAGRWIARHGTRRICTACGLAMATGIALLLAMPGYPALLAMLAVFGVANGLFDVAINAEAAALEQRDRLALMSSMHGMFSVGGMAGAGFGSLLLARAVAAQTHLLWVAALMAVAILVATRGMTVAPASAAAATDAATTGRPRGLLLALGVLAGIGLLAEGAMYDWSVLYLQRAIGSPQEQAALAYAAFSAAMAAARFGGDRARARWSPRGLLQASAAVAATGIALLLLADGTPLALAGCALAGIGFANIVPILFSAASTVPGTPAASAIASVSAIGYLGFMGGPPVIGFLAGLSSLTAALWLVVAAAVVLCLAAGRVLRPRPS